MLSLCVLLWAHEGKEGSLSEYEDAVLPLVPEHGGAVVQRVRRVDDGAGPLEVQLIRLPGEDALNAYMQDPRRLALADAHRAAVARTEVIRVEPVT